MAETSKYLTVNQIAEKLSLHPFTVYQWTSQKKIPHIKLGSKVRFVEKDIEAWMKEKTVQEFKY